MPPHWSRLSPRSRAAVELHCEHGPLRDCRKCAGKWSCCRQHSAAFLPVFDGGRHSLVIPTIHRRLNHLVRRDAVLCESLAFCSCANQTCAGPLSASVFATQPVTTKARCSSSYVAKQGRQASAV